MGIRYDFNEKASPLLSRTARRFLRFREIGLLAILLFHTVTALFTIPILVLQSASTMAANAFLMFILLNSIVVALLALSGLLGFASYVLFEMCWTGLFFFLELIGTSLYSSSPYSPTVVGLAWTQTLLHMLYTATLFLMIISRKKNLSADTPNTGPLWGVLIKDVQWHKDQLHTFTNKGMQQVPSSGITRQLAANTVKIIAPWNQQWDQQFMDCEMGNNNDNISPESSPEQPMVLPPRPVSWVVEDPFHSPIEAGEREVIHQRLHLQYLQPRLQPSPFRPVVGSPRVLSPVFSPQRQQSERGRNPRFPPGLTVPPTARTRPVSRNITHPVRRQHSRSNQASPVQSHRRRPSDSAVSASVSDASNGSGAQNAVRRPTLRDIHNGPAAPRMGLSRDNSIGSGGGGGGRQLLGHVRNESDERRLKAAGADWI